FQQQELEIVANVARYHRGADPKRKHENFQQLNDRDQQRVRQMAAILRVAGGLDRSNTQQVTAAKLDFLKKGEMRLRVSAAHYPEVDIWAARKRSKLFEKVFDTSLVIEWDAVDARPNGAQQSGDMSGNGRAASEKVRADQARAR